MDLLKRMSSMANLGLVNEGERSYPEGSPTKIGTKDEGAKATSPGTMRRLFKSSAFAVLGFGRKLKIEDEEKKVEEETEVDEDAEYEEKIRKQKADEELQRVEAMSKILTKSRKSGWNFMKTNVAAKGRKHLEAEIRASMDAPELSVIAKLAHTCLDKPHHSSAAAYDGALLMEWAERRQFELDDDEKLLLAKAHAEVWLSRGLGAEAIHLYRANQLYNEVLGYVDLSVEDPDIAETQDPKIWLSYARVLQNLGARKEALEKLKYMSLNFHGDPNSANYMFYIGALLKAEGHHDEAANFLFEATQSGPPRFFSKLDMMFIISRNIEEEGMKQGEPNEEAYEMVFQHLKLEELISQDLMYDTWINDSQTWRTLGDKCAVHGVYSLATDLYAQGLMKDMNAFRKPKLWFGFAKACHRCNRDSDAKLAIKQALTMEPYNSQLLRADYILENPTHSFEEVIELDDIHEVLDSLHKHHDPNEKGANKLQALFRGKSDRHGLRKAVGDRQDLSKKMVVRECLVLGGKHPVFLTAKASWLGTVTSVIATDMEGYRAIMQLQQSFTPTKETSSIPRKFKLRMICKKDEEIDRHNVALRFEDEGTGEYIEREMSLSWREHDDQGHILHRQSTRMLKEGLTEDVDDTTVEGAIEKRYKYSHGEKWRLLDSLRWKDTKETVSDISEIEVEKGGVYFQDSFYMYQIRLEDVETVIALLQVSTDKRVEFRCPREHLDRSRKLRKWIFTLLSLMCQQTDIKNTFGMTCPEGEEETVDGMISIPSTELKVRFIIDSKDQNGIEGMVAKLKEMYGRPLLSGHLERLVPHLERQMTSMELAAEQRASDTHDSSMKAVLRRAKTMHRERKAELKRMKTENPDAFDLSSVSVAVTKSSYNQNIYIDKSGKGVRTGITPDKASQKASPGTIVDPVVSVPTATVNAEEKEDAKDTTTTPLISGENGVKVLGVDHTTSDDVNNDNANGSQNDDAISVMSLDSGLKDLGERDTHHLTTTGTTSRVSTGHNSDDEEEEEEDAFFAGASPKSKKKKNKKEKGKDERNKARKKAMKEKLEAGLNSSLTLMFDDSGEGHEEARQRERDKKKAEARKKMAQEKAKMEALVRERSRKKQSVNPTEMAGVTISKEEKGKSGRKTQKAASLDASIFLKHQEDRFHSSEYLLKRANDAKHKIRTQESADYLKKRSAKAIMEVKAEEKREEVRLKKEAESKSRETDDDSVSGKSKDGFTKFGRKALMSGKAKNKFKKGLKKKGAEQGDGESMGSDSDTSPGKKLKKGAKMAGMLAGVGSKKRRGSVDSDGGSQEDEEDGASLSRQASEDRDDMSPSEEMMTGVSAASGTGEDGDEGVDREDATGMGGMPMVSESRDENDENDERKSLQDYDDSLQDVDATSALAQAAMNAFGISPSLLETDVSVASEGSKNKSMSILDQDGPPEFVPPKKAVTLDRYPVFKKPVPKRERLGTINMFKPPTLSYRQQQQLRRPLELHELPPSAFGSADGLLAALRQHYSGEGIPSEDATGVPTKVEDSSLVAEPSMLATTMDGNEGNEGNEGTTTVDGVPQTEGSDGDTAMFTPGSGVIDPVENTPAAERSNGDKDNNGNTSNDGAAAVMLSSSMPLTATTTSEGNDETPITVMNLTAPSALDPAGALPSANKIISPIKVNRKGNKSVYSTINMTVDPALVAMPLPINQNEQKTLYGPGTIRDVGVIQDAQMDAYIMKQRRDYKNIQLILKEEEKKGVKPEKLTSTFAKLMRKAHSSPFDPQPLPNNLSFLDAVGSMESVTLAKKSKETFKNRGYVDGDPAYTKYWEDKLYDCLALYSNGLVLRKAIASLLKLCPLPITKVEAFCALANADGSQIEALGRLQDSEFVREVKTVCQLLPVSLILTTLPGALPAADTMMVDMSTYPGQMGNAIALSSSVDGQISSFMPSPGMDRPAEEYFQPISKSPVIRATQSKITATPTYFEQNKLDKSAQSYISTAPGYGDGSVVSSNSQSNRSATQLRLHTDRAEKNLPHMNMYANSPIVRSRSTAIKFKKQDPYPAHPYLEPLYGTSQQSPPVSASFGAGLVAPGDGMAGVIGTAPTSGGVPGGRYASRSSSIDSINDLNLSTQGRNMERGRGSGKMSTSGSLDHIAPIRSSSPLSFNGSRKTSPKTGGNKSIHHVHRPADNSRNLMSTLDKMLSTSQDKRNNNKRGNKMEMSGNNSLVSSLKNGSIQRVEVTPYTKSLRLSAAIDVLYDQSPASTLVMCRRDAQRAQEEETLSKSLHDEFRDIALKRSKGMLEKFASKSKASTAFSMSM